MNWQERLLASVSPLRQGVAGLDVIGFRVSGQQPPRPARTAAVLVGILDTERPEILLTRRARHLTHHPGQVSFPGGAMAGRGESGVLTALREAEEEIGLLPDKVRPIGFLDRVDTVSDFRVLPVVGLVSQSPPWTPDESEVEEVFSIPLDWALDLASYTAETAEREGTRYALYSLDWEGRRIWGVTAWILRNLALRHRQPAPAAAAVEPAR